MKNYGADLTNARANAGAIVLYQHEELSLIKAIEGLKALQSARTAFKMVNPEIEDTEWGNGTPYDAGMIANMITRVETQLRQCQSRIQNMKESFNVLTGLTWMEKVEQGLVRAPNYPLSKDSHYGWTREEDETNGTILLTKED